MATQTLKGEGWKKGMKAEGRRMNRSKGAVRERFGG